MAKKSASNAPAALTFRDLVLGADAETLRQALEARLRIDELIAERQAAYERIAALETQVEDVIGEPGVFPFPAPPLPVAGLDPKADSLLRPASGASAPGPAASAKKSPGRPAAAPAPSEVSADEDDDEDSTADEADREADVDPDTDAAAEADSDDDDTARA